jgi:acetyl esterase/lipase
MSGTTVSRAGAAASWQSRIVQAVMRRLVAPRLSLAHGVAPFRRTLDLLAAAPPCPPPRGFARWPATLGGVPGEWLRRHDRQTADAPVLLHFHGGGFVAGTPRLGRRIVARIAARAGVDAFSVDYRLAPEHPFPAAVDDAVACYRALVADGVIPGRIVLAGESAGAALALALAIRIATDGSPGPGPAALVLLSPWVDLTLTGASLTRNAGDDPGLSRNLLVAARRLYKPDEGYADPLASPLFGRLAALPPTLIQAGTGEILLDDARRLTSRLAEAGVDRRLEEWGGMHHAWHLAPGVVPEVADAFDAIARFIARR